MAKYERFFTYHIPFFSRISNDTVLKEAGKQPLNRRFLQQQLLSNGRVARATEDDVLKARNIRAGEPDPSHAEVRLEY